MFLTVFSIFDIKKQGFWDLGFKGVRFVRYFRLAATILPKLRQRICHHRGFQSELRADFLRIGKLRPRSFQCVSFHPVIRNIASQNGKKFSSPRKHTIRTRNTENACFTTF